MEPEALIELGMQQMFNAFGVGLLLLFCGSVLLGFVAFVRSVIG